MNRHYTTDEFAKGVELLRKYFDRPAITTDIIAGFPGETKEEFERSYEFAKEMRFFEIHAFPYSVRKGTAAAKLPDRKTKEEKKERVARLLKLTESSRKEFADSLNGMKEEVLIEADNTGHLRRYAEAKVRTDKTLKQGDIVSGVISADKDGNIELIP
jgi:threonylcarbamoyladenosine tRNA methylthiotransferase MtaB